MFELPIMERHRLAAGCRLPHLDTPSTAAGGAHHLNDEIDGAAHVAGEVDDAMTGEIAVELDCFINRERRAVRVDSAHEALVPGVQQAQRREGVSDGQLA